MSKPRVYDEQPTFAGGLNANGQRAVVDPSQFADVTNMRVLANGEIAKRPGWRAMASAPAAVIRPHSWNRVTGAQGVGINIGNGVLYTFAYTNTPAPDITLTATAYTPGTSVGEDIAHFRDASGEALYLSNASGKVWKWDGTTATALGASTPSNIRQLWVYNQRLFGVTGDNATLYWSDLNDGDTLGDTASGGGSAVVRTYGGGVIYTGGAVGSTNYIVHDDSISRFNGMGFDDIDITAGVSGVGRGVGGIGLKSFEVIDNVGYLVSKTGLWLLSEGDIVRYAADDRSDPILEALQTAYNTASTSVEIVNNTRSDEVWFKLDLVTSDLGDITEPRIFIYSKTRRRFVGQMTFDAATAVFDHPTLFLDNTYVTDFSGGVSQQMIAAIVMSDNADFTSGTVTYAACDFVNPANEVYYDNYAPVGSTIKYESAVRCRRFFCGNTASTKSFRRAVVTMGSGAGGSATADSVTGAEMSVTTPVGGTVATTTDLHAGVPNNIPLAGQGAYVDVTITDGGDTSTGWSVASVAVEAFDMGWRGR